MFTIGWASCFAYSWAISRLSLWICSFITCPILVGFLWKMWFWIHKISGLVYQVYPSKTQLDSKRREESKIFFCESLLEKSRNICPGARRTHLSQSNKGKHNSSSCRHRSLPAVSFFSIIFAFIQHKGKQFDAHSHSRRKFHHLKKNSMF